MTTAPVGGDDEAVAVLRAVSAELDRVDPDQLWRLAEGELGEGIEMAQRIVQRLQGLAVALVAEADSRRVGVETGRSRAQWVLDVAPSLEPGPAARLTRVAAACSETALAGLRAAVVAGQVPIDHADLIASFHGEADALAEPQSLAATVRTMVDQAPALTKRQLRTAIRYALAHLQPAATQERLADAQRAARALYRSGLAGTGMCEYRLVLDPEGAAILDAAIDPLSAPVPDPTTGMPDPRPAATRRADALVEVVARSLGRPPTTHGVPPARIVVTFAYESLAAALWSRRRTAATGRPAGQVADPVRRHRATAGDDIEAGRGPASRSRDGTDDAEAGRGPASRGRGGTDDAEASRGPASRGRGGTDDAVGRLGPSQAVNPPPTEGSRSSRSWPHAGPATIGAPNLDPPNLDRPNLDPPNPDSPLPGGSLTSSRVAGRPSPGASLAPSGPSAGSLDDADVGTRGVPPVTTAPSGAGVSWDGQVLTPETVRRLACDAEIIPAVLGTERQLLELGRSRRLVSAGQRTALWLRDRGCTFPGCTIPAAWTRAHHITHWAAGGATDLTNLALLCQRHHTEVHARHLTATVLRDAPPGSAVTWHG